MFIHSNHIHLSIYTLITPFPSTGPNRMQNNLTQLGLENECLPRDKTEYTVGGC